MKNLKEVISFIENAKVLTSKEFSQVPRFQGQYLAIINNDTLLYNGETFSKGGTTRQKQHYSGDTCISSFTNYLKTNCLIPNTPEWLYEDADLGDRHKITVAYQRDWVKHNIKYIWLETPQTFEDGSSVEDAIYEYYKNVRLTATRFKNITLINHPGRKLTEDEFTAMYLLKLSRHITSNKQVTIKSTNVQYKTIRVNILNSKDYLNIVSGSLNSEFRINYYINKNARTVKSLELISDRLQELGISYNDNDKTISFRIIPEATNVAFAVLEAIDTIFNFEY